MSVIEIKNNDEFKEKVLDSKDKVLVDFNADWCGPCQMLKPIMEEIGEDNKVVSVNTDANPDLAEKYGVMSIPCVVLIKDGKEINRTVGFHTKDEILDMLK